MVAMIFEIFSPFLRMLGTRKMDRGPSLYNLIRYNLAVAKQGLVMPAIFLLTDVLAAGASNTTAEAAATTTTTAATAATTTTPPRAGLIKSLAIKNTFQGLVLLK